MDCIILLFKFLFSPIGYYYYHKNFMQLLNTVMAPVFSEKRVFWSSFFMTYLSFTVYSQLQLHLILNWTLITFLMVIEIRCFYKCLWGGCLFHGLSYTLMGLSFNIFFRSLMAVFLNVPPQAFDNNIYTAGNLKAFPVTFGFFATGYFYHRWHFSNWAKKYAALANDKSSLYFMLQLMAAMYIYLTLNLLLYYTPRNILLLKLWSMKTGVSVILGYGIAVLFTSRMQELNQYRYENLKAKEEIAARAYEEQRLYSMAHTDPLTGLYTRKYAEARIENLMKSKEAFSLCFVDLNGLKYVNDTMGHQYGDHYLTAAATALSNICQNRNDLLCRYGGDEFLLLLVNCTPETASGLLEQAKEQLKRGEIACEDFLPSFSYGIVGQEGFTDANEMITAADQLMYADKLEYRKNVLADSGLCKEII